MHRASTAAKLRSSSQNPAPADRRGAARICGWNGSARWTGRARVVGGARERAGPRVWRVRYGSRIPRWWRVGRVLVSLDVRTGICDLAPRPGAHDPALTTRRSRPGAHAWRPRPGDYRRARSSHLGCTDRPSADTAPDPVVLPSRTPAPSVWALGTVIACRSQINSVRGGPVDVEIVMSRL